MGTRILNELSSLKWSYRGNDDIFLSITDTKIWEPH